MGLFTGLFGVAVCLVLVSCGGSSRAPAPVASINASQPAVKSGEAATLTWSSTNATGCTASGGWSGSLAVSGSQSSGPLSAPTTFTISCSGAGGTGQNATVTINIIPTATLAANPTTVGNGGVTTLTWNSTNATACTASGAWSGSLAANGSQASPALSADSTFAITCSGPGGLSDAATTAVTVLIAPTVTLSAYPTVVGPGGTSTLTWTSLNTSSCTASGNWSGPVATSGAQATAPISANAAYSLRCAGTDGTQAVATATVQFSNVTMALSPSNSSIPLTQTQQFTATVPGGGPATWTVDSIPGGSGLAGTISDTGLFTAGTTPGAHTVVATSVANNTVSAAAAVGVTDLAGVLTFHNNLARDGSNTQEYALTTGTVTTAHFGKLASCATDGAIYGQPLWVPNLTMGGTRRNVIYVATQHDSVFAFDADAHPCLTLWKANLLDSGHGGTAGETAVPFDHVGVAGGSIQPEIGVTGTPVIDASRGILYVVSKSVSPGHTYFQRLHAIDLLTGSDEPGAPATISGTYPGTGDGGTQVAFDARQELQRTGLVLVNGVVYMAFASHEDKSPWYGWVMGYQYTGSALNQTAVLNVAPNLQRAGIWMSSGAPAVDASNNLYVVTGNGPFDPATKDFGDSLLQLTPGLTVSQWFTPTNQLANAQMDKDFGSGGATMLADLPAGNTITHALLCGGKDHALYVINRDTLGGLGDEKAVQKIDFGAAIFATGAFWNNNFYLAGLNGPLNMLKLNTSNAQFTLSSSSSHTYGFPGATPSISASGTSNGIVWTLQSSAYCNPGSNSCGPVVLFAHDAGDLTKQLWSSADVAADAAGIAVKFTVPTVANGKVYVGTQGNNRGGTSTPGELEIYGLKP